jgi:cytochrome b subunit of formate dehydrogenase
VTHDFRISYAPLRDGAIVTGATLLTAHVALWPWRGRIPLLARYAIGVAAIGLGETVACLQTRDYHAIARFWALAAMGGAVTGALHGVRAITHHQRRQRQEAIRHGVYERRS